MQVLFYTWIALCGFGAGWGLGDASVSWLVWPCLISALLSAWMLPRSEVPNAMPGLSPAYRAWFSSSAGCMVVLLLVWAAFGWSLPSLSMDGLRLDPAGALGWDQAWLMQRLAIVQWLMIAGLVGLMGALGWWVWQKRAGKLPKVVLGWVFAPFFWMASLGLLVGISQPWRQAPTHSLAQKWHAGLAPVATVALAKEAITLANKDEAAAVWAHALALKAYQQKQWSRSDLDAFLAKLASLNAARPHAPLFASAVAVGVDNTAWCVANAARTPQASVDWVKAQSGCTGKIEGRNWAWHAP